MTAVPKSIATAIKAGKVDLNDPANMVLLLKANAVVGVTGFFEPDGKRLKSVGNSRGSSAIPTVGRCLYARHRSTARWLAEPRP